MNRKLFVFSAILLIGIAPGASAQIVRNVNNPYAQTGGSGFGSSPGNAYNRSNGSSISPLSIINGTYSVPLSNKSPYGDGSRLNLTSRPANCGYTTGGMGSYTYRQPVNPNPIGGYGTRADLPRRAFDRWASERDRQAIGEPAAPEDVSKNLANVPPQEIASGAAANAIIKALEPLSDRVKALPATAMDEAFLKRLNFSRGSGSLGLLRQEGKIVWPALLMKLEPKEQVEKVRQQIESRFQDAFSQVANGDQADPDNLKLLLKAIDLMGELASEQAQSMTFSENVGIKRQLKSLEDSIAFLKQRDAADWLPGKPKIKPQSIQELILMMQQKGVRFAPAFEGNEPAYLTMHRALVALYAQVTPVP